MLHRTRDQLSIKSRTLASSVQIQFVENLFSSRSNHPRLISDWLAEMDFAACVEELDHPGFVVDKHQMEFETLDSKIAKGSMKNPLAEFKRKIHFSEKNTILEQNCQMLTGRPIMFHILSVFTINMTQGSPAGKEDRPPCFNYKRRNCSHDRECDYEHPPHCKYFKKDRCEMGRNCPFDHPQRKKRSTSPPKTKESDKGEVSVAIVNIANHCSMVNSGKLLQVET